ncbi:MAG TPA: ATP-binding protein, partial [Acidobacteriaceae bacterium]
MPTETTYESLKAFPRSRPKQAAPPAEASAPCDVIAALSALPQLSGLCAQEYAWLAAHSGERVGREGALVWREDDPSHHLHFILSGEVHVHRRNGGPAALYMGRAGQITGKLPYSRMKTWGGDGCAAGLLWILDLHQDLFPAMLAAIPSMAQRSVSVMLDRVREFTRADEQAAKLTALGKLAANMAHELNNPASAARSAAMAIAHSEEDEAKYQLGRVCRGEAELESCRSWTRQALHGVATGLPPARWDVGEWEDRLLAWLEAHGVREAWSMAPALAEMGLPVESLEALAAFACPEALALTVSDLAGAIRRQRTAATIVASTARIFEIVTAIKDYSYMDQAPIQDVDLAQSIETTLAMLASRLEGVTIEREYAAELPAVRGFGSELNQVWTALLENALDAMQDRGTLKLVTRLRAQTAFVEIWDDGPGIGPALTARIFEPFFTTKPLGRGLGLGLDMVQRIVGKHFGSVQVESRP